MSTVFARNALLPSGWTKNVRVEIGAGGRIASVAGQADPAGEVAVEALLPAPANLHSHTFQRAMAGLAERRGPARRDSFWTWRETMYRFLDVLSPDEIEAIATLAFMEMQEAGFAAVAEFHYLHHQPGGSAYAELGELSSRIAAAASQSGIGLTLLPVFYEQGGVDGRPLKGGQLRFASDPARFGRLLDRCGDIVKALPPDARLGVAPHSLRAVSAVHLRELTAAMPDAPFHMHIAEQEAEVEETLAVHGARPVSFLLDNFEVDGRWCLIHCTHMDANETERLARTGAVAGLCPVTEANLGDGIFDGARWLAASGRLGIGSDSNIRISFHEELRQLEYSQRLRDRARIVLADPDQSCGRRLFDAALAGGAQALGRDSGAIEAGRFADLVALDPARLDDAPAGDPLLDHWIFTGGSNAVAEVWSAGRHVVRAGRHVAREAISARYRAALASIRGRL
jgi:formimidoylglutamate deiminase